MILLLFWKQQRPNARAATIARHNEAALVRRAIVEGSRDSSVLSSLNVVDCLTPLLQHNKMSQPQSAYPCFTNKFAQQQNKKKSEESHAWISSPVANNLRNRSRVTLMRCDTEAFGVLALSSPVLRS